MVSEISTSFQGQSASSAAARRARRPAPASGCPDGSGGFIRARIGLSG